MKKKLFSNGVRHNSQPIKRLFKKYQSIHLQVIVSVLSVFLFSSCQEYLAASITLAVLPEILFATFMVVVIIIALIGGIIHLITGGDK